MRYFVNAPGKKPRRRKKKPTAKQLRARRKFAAMAKARSKAASKSKRATTRRKPVMAKRKRSSAGKRRRRSTVKRRSPVRLVRRGVTVYQGNPRRRRRGARRSYRRNPGFVAQGIGIVKDSLAVKGGQIAGNFVNNMLPSFGGPIGDLAKGAAVAIGIRMFGSRFLGTDMARLAAAGAMQGPLTALIVNFVPGAAPLLADYDDMTLGSYGPGVSGYLDSGDMGESEDVEVGSYAGDNY